MMHNRWQMRQRVDLARDPEAPIQWQSALMVRGDENAHDWIVEVTEHDAPLRLSGATVMAYFSRDETQETIIVKGRVELGRACVTLPQACYAVPGPLTGVMRLTLDDDVTVTVAAGRWQIGEGSYDAIIDPSNMIPSLEALLAQIEVIEQLTNKLKNLTATATSVPSLEMIGVDVSDTGSGIHFAFKIPTASALASYPVGSLYMSMETTSPAQLFGGEWEKLDVNANMVTNNVADQRGYKAELTPLGTLLPAHQSGEGTSALLFSYKYDDKSVAIQPTKDVYYINVWRRTA